MAQMRLDDLVVARGLAADRKEAAALILRGLIQVDGRVGLKAGSPVRDGVNLELLGKGCPYASRGGLKLEAALESLEIDPGGWVCVDLGSSTGGFTDCLLQKGARRVYAFDVGQGQLDWKLRQDPRVQLTEGLNVRFLERTQVPEPVHLIVADLSFISLRLILPVLRSFTGARCLLLVKPQFEAEPSEVGKGGIIRDPAKQLEIVSRVEDSARAAGFQVLAVFPSPVLGQKGNREYFLYLC